MAKLVRRVTSNDEIVGSNPARGISFFSQFNIQCSVGVPSNYITQLFEKKCL